MAQLLIGGSELTPPESLPQNAFERGSLLREGTWVVAFLADWCPFCRRFAPEFAAVDGGPAFRTGIADVSEETSPLWDEFGIEVIPAVIVFRDGQPTLRLEATPGVGLPPDALEATRRAAEGGAG